MMMRLIHDKNINPDDEQLFSQRRESFDYFSTVVFILNVSIGTGVMKLGAAFKAGAVLSVLLSTFIAILSTYTFYLFLKSAAKTKSSTFEGIWAKTFGHKTVVVCAVISMTSKLMALKAYISFVCDQLVYLIKLVLPNHPSFLVDRFFLFAAVMVVFYIPVLSSKSLKVIFYCCLIKVTCLAFLCIVIVYYFITFTIQDGFDPRNEIAYFRFDNRFISALDSLLTAYLVMPICYPGLKHFRNLTVNTFLNQYKVSMFITWIVYNIVGLICYFTFFDQNTGGLILSYYPENTLTIIAQVALTLMMIFTCPVALNPVRYVLVDLVSRGSEFPSDVWCQAGIIIMVLAILLSSLKGDVNFWVSTITNIRSPLVLFILPSILYLKAWGTHNKLHFVLALLVFVIGLVSVAFVLYLPFA
ncbi:Transmembrane amino acid transporter protein [Tritrichomonas foetus]|uniref:Transmembrane amino acid transporter protein n=1 Tax=Tritrichomonas foetus TaxID=1144522 RepID=A0A1J4L695_9EUKA|nr:Transmembrane amino acid transporter protein [Tritrichomonas foetus]|eukprot:OHT17469.1 Transmembrane amino acid transporter protein [Tritrichomonas foetus]